MKTIIVTEKILNKFAPYQGQDKKLAIGDTLFILTEKVPKVYRRNGSLYFGIVTDWKLSSNSLIHSPHLADKANDPSYSWAFNRWSIDQNLIPKK